MIQNSKLVSFVLIAFLAAKSVFAAPIFYENFESFTQGNPPASPWSITSPSSVDVQGVTHQSPIGQLSDDQGVRLRNLTGGTGGDTPRMDRSIAPSAASTLYVQFDYYGDSFATNNGFQLLGFNGTSNVNAVNIHMLGAGFPNTTQVNQLGTFGNLAVDTDPGKWYRYTFTVNPVNTATDTFDLRIQTLENNSLDQTFLGLNFQNNVNSLVIARFHFNITASGIGGEYRIDNVLLTTDPNDLNFAVIPEPACMAMGLAGMSLLWIYRRRFVTAAPDISCQGRKSAENS